MEKQCEACLHPVPTVLVQLGKMVDVPGINKQTTCFMNGGVKERHIAGNRKWSQSEENKGCLPDIDFFTSHLFIEILKENKIIYSHRIPNYDYVST